MRTGLYKYTSKDDENVDEQEVNEESNEEIYSLSFLQFHLSQPQFLHITIMSIIITYVDTFPK